MRHLTLCLLALFLIAPKLNAAEPTPDNDYVPNVVEAQAHESEPAVESSLNLDKVTVHETAPADDAPAAQLGERWGFWWVVGVIVVAGVILALVL